MAGQSEAEKTVLRHLAIQLLVQRHTEREIWTDDIHVESDMWCSLDEDSLVVPFWLKAVNFSKSHHRGDVSGSGGLDG